MRRGVQSRGSSHATGSSSALQHIAPPIIVAQPKGAAQLSARACEPGRFARSRHRWLHGGPTNIREGGYFSTLRKATTDLTRLAWGDHGRGFPYPLKERMIRNAAIIARPIDTRRRSRLAGGIRNT